MSQRGTPNSTIGDGSVFEGKFYITGSLRIDGKFEGDIRTEDRLLIGQTGKVRSNIRAKYAEVAGTVIGNITAEEEVILAETGRILGDINAPKLTVNHGVVISGRVNITGGQKKEARKIVEDAFAGGPFLPGGKEPKLPAVPGEEKPLVDVKLGKRRRG